MTNFIEDYDKPEGIVQKIILPAINQINSDDTLDEIKDNIYNSFSDLTGDYFKKMILSFDIFKVPPTNVLSDFPMLYEKSMIQFKSELSGKVEDSYINFVNNLFKLFSDPTGDLSIALLLSTIQLSAQVKYEIKNDDILNILNKDYFEQNSKKISELSVENINLINAYLNYFIFKFVASQFILVFTPPAPVPPIILPVIPTGPLTTSIISAEFKSKVELIINSQNLNK